jgi:transcriptional regulator with XRE-family HTH domain
MKKTDTLSALLGLTQGQMALLLQVHPSQWSMYESGKRNLPLRLNRF